jgi:hypothetical protein
MTPQEKYQLAKAAGHNDDMARRIAESPQFETLRSHLEQQAARLREEEAARVAKMRKDVADLSIPLERRKVIQAQLDKIDGEATPKGTEAGAPAATSTTSGAGAPASTTPSSTSTPPSLLVNENAPKGIEDRRLKIPPRHRAVWRTLNRWAGSPHRVDCVIVSTLGAVARSLEKDWDGFSTAAVRSAIKFLGDLGVLDIRREPQSKAQKDGWRRQERGTFKETPFEVYVKPVPSLDVRELAARVARMPKEARASNPSAAARQRRRRERQRKATECVTSTSPNA